MSHLYQPYPPAVHNPYPNSGASTFGAHFWFAIFRLRLFWVRFFLLPFTGVTWKIYPLAKPLETHKHFRRVTCSSPRGNKCIDDDADDEGAVGRFVAFAPCSTVQQWHKTLTLFFLFAKFKILLKFQPLNTALLLYEVCMPCTQNNRRSLRISLVEVELEFMVFACVRETAGYLFCDFSPLQPQRQ